MKRVAGEINCSSGLTRRALGRGRKCERADDDDGAEIPAPRLRSRQQPGPLAVPNYSRGLESGSSSLGLVTKFDAALCIACGLCSAIPHGERSFTGVVGKRLATTSHLFHSGPHHGAGQGRRVVTSNSGVVPESNVLARLVFIIHYVIVIPLSVCLQRSRAEQVQKRPPLPRCGSHCVEGLKSGLTSSMHAPLAPPLVPSRPRLHHVDDIRRDLPNLTAGLQARHKAYWRPREPH